MLGGLGRARGRTGKPVFYGWWIVAAGGVSQAYTSGAFWQGFGAFFDPIVAQFGWSRALTAGAVSIQRTESGMIAPFVGLFIDRFGPRRVMLAGNAVTGLGFILLSQIQSLWQFYAAFVLITVGLSFGTFLVVTTTVANWFISLRGRALALMSAGSALGGLLVPVIVWLIAVTDWRMGLIVIGVGFWVVGIPVSLVMRSRPEDYGEVPDGRREDQLSEAEGPATGPAGSGDAPSRRTRRVEAEFTVREALGTWSFWQLAMAMAGGQLIMSASVHQIPALTEFGLSREAAGLVILAVSIMSLAGRLGSGFLGDMVDKRRVIAFAFTCQMIGTVIFAYIGNNWHLVGFIIFWGIGFGASVPVRFALLADFYGRRHYGSIMGTMMTISTVFGVIGPVFVGWMADVRESYRDPYLVLSVAVMVSVPLILTVGSPVHRQIGTGKDPSLRSG